MPYHMHEIEKQVCRGSRLYIGQHIHKFKSYAATCMHMHVSSLGRFHSACPTLSGAVTVEQTVECGCEEPTCYREDYFESHWEVVGNGTVVREKVIVITLYMHVYTD